MQRLKNLFVPIVGLALLLGFTSCESENPMESSEPAFSTLGTYGVATTNLDPANEILYLTDSGTEDGTTLFEVTLNEGTNEAELTELYVATTNFDQVDALAVSPDGTSVYLIDKKTSHLGLYDATDGSFVDKGEIAGLPEGVVLAAFSPDGTLYVGNQANESIYTVDVNSLTATLEKTVSFGLEGADMAFEADGTLYLWSNEGYNTGTVKGLYVREPGEENFTSLTTELPEDFYTGLAIDQFGTGNLLGSNTTDDAVVVLSKVDGTQGTAYAMTKGGSSYDYRFGDMSSGKLAADEVCIPFSTDIYAAAGQNDINKGTLVGELTAYSDGDYLYVTYDVSDRGCTLNELHLWVGTDYKDIPKNAAPGKFPYKEDDLMEGTDQYTFMIPLSELQVECGGNIYIAAHAVVSCDGWTETAWAYGDDTFIDKKIARKWGWFANWEICCEDNVKISVK